MNIIKHLKSKVAIPMLGLLLCCMYSESSYAQNPEILGKVRSASITEISGIIPYSYEEGYFWVHNDSGDKSAFYLIDKEANLKVIVDVKGVKFIDIEEIGRFNINGVPHLVIADMGNNSRNREILSLYVITEPKLNTEALSVNMEVDIVKQIRFKYADKRRDAEAFFIDPIDGHLYIFSKRDFKSEIFRVALDLQHDEVQELHSLGKLPFTFSTAADISADGKHILIKNITDIFYWERSANESILQTLSKKYNKIPYKVEPQGEALCFDLNKRYFYTISERALGLEAYLYKYEY